MFEIVWRGIEIDPSNMRFNLIAWVECMLIQHIRIFTDSLIPVLNTLQITDIEKRNLAKLCLVVIKEEREEHRIRSNDQLARMHSFYPKGDTHHVKCWLECMRQNRRSDRMSRARRDDYYKLWRWCISLTD